MPEIGVQFDSAVTRREAAVLGIWTFLATEVLFFGGLFLAYAVYRISFPEAFAAASRHTKFALGTLNTAVLLTSSLTMALGVERAKERKLQDSARFLRITAALGGLFMLIKGFEYSQEIAERLLPGANFHLEGASGGGAEIFFYLYFVMTGLHALHLSIGIVLLLVMSRRIQAGTSATAIEVSGLYWHFVDLVWVFLYPLLYLIERHR